MYPRITDIFSDLFGFDFPIPLYSFGAMVALAAITAGWLLGKELDRYHEAGRIKGVKIPDPEKKKGKRGKISLVEVAPSAIVWTVTVIALISGFAGAKIFHVLENLDDFFLDPSGMLFSSGGFTFYGGLIVGTVVVVWYLRKKGISAPIFADALAPGLMIAYGIGRIGCHLAGDGDWGIVSDPAARPSWLPTWLWAETYPRNILGQDLSTTPVYPTSIYEFLMSLVIFGILWSVRKHPFKAGWLFSLYLVFNGIERFLIEKIRVNNTFDLFGITVTQAEVIATLIFLLGIVGLFFTSRRIVSESDTKNAATA